MSLHCRAGGCVCLPFLSSACGMDQSGGAQNKNPAEKQQAHKLKMSGPFRPSSVCQGGFQCHLVRGFEGPIGFYVFKWPNFLGVEPEKFKKIVFFVTSQEFMLNFKSSPACFQREN